MMRSSAFGVLLIGGLLFAACGGGSPESVGNREPAAPASTPATAPAVASAPAAADAPEPKTVADLFPPGPEKAMVMNNCASCHSVACSVIGQRTPERWDSLRDAHKERVANADIGAMFAYLKANFDSSKPEPKVPPAFLEGGCTPF